MSITPIEAALLAQLLRPRVQLLTDLLAAQVQALPPGDDSWADTEIQLEVAAAALQKVEAIR
jgi:hypothetical protein